MGGMGHGVEVLRLLVDGLDWIGIGLDWDWIGIGLGSGGRG